MTSAKMMTTSTKRRKRPTTRMRPVSPARHLVSCPYPKPSVNMCDKPSFGQGRLPPVLVSIPCAWLKALPL